MLKGEWGSEYRGYNRGIYVDYMSHMLNSLKGKMRETFFGPFSGSLQYGSYRPYFTDPGAGFNYERALQPRPSPTATPFFLFLSGAFR